MLKYSKHYSKLDLPLHATIRRYLKGRKSGDVVKEIVNGKVLQYSKIVLIERLTVNQMSTDFLLKDTDCTTRIEAIRLLNSFYTNPISLEYEKLYVIHVKVVKKNG